VGEHRATPSARIDTTGLEHGVTLFRQAATDFKAAVATD